MRIRNYITGLGLAAVLGLSSCADDTEVRQVGDFTNDGIEDILMYRDAFSGAKRGMYLLIGQPDGSYLSTKEKTRLGVTFYLSDDGDAYFYNGDFYQKAVDPDSGVQE